MRETHFFPREGWIAPPRDWSRTTQTGATYDLSHGEGFRIWEECQHRTGAPAAALVEDPLERYGAAVLHRPRLGQGIFRIQVLEAYGRACAVTGEHSLPVVDSAHIQPYAFGGEHAVANGLALRTDLHRLFDRGYITIDSDDRLIVGRRLKEDFENGRSYYSLHGQLLVLPSTEQLRPSAEALARHRAHAFLG